MDEIGVTRAVGRLDLDVRFGHGHGVQRALQHEGGRCAQAERTELTAAQRRALRIFLEVVVVVILIAHKVSPGLWPTMPDEAV